MTAQAENDAAPIAAAIIVRDGQVLMVRRRIKEGSLSWQFPAGAVESGETGQHAAVREAHEEVGLHVRPVETLGERVHPATGRTMIYVACEVVNGEAYVADSDELAEVEWCDKAKLVKYVPYPFFGPVQAHFDAVLS